MPPKKDEVTVDPAVEAADASAAEAPVEEAPVEEAPVEPVVQEELPQGVTGEFYDRALARIKGHT
jgi:hypothetical protein